MTIKIESIINQWDSETARPTKSLSVSLTC